MNLQRLFPFVLVLTVGCRTLSAEHSSVLSTTPGPESTVTTASTAEPVPEIKPDEQIDLNRYVLQTNTDESQRIVAANLLIFNPNPYARKVLIDTLNLTNNSPARMAVCNALIQARTNQKEIPDKNDFIEPLLNIFSTKVDDEAHLAADAIMIYNYNEIGPLLDKIVTDPNKPAKTRINVIEALKKVWEKKAIIRLYRLVDDPDQEVSAEAGKALRSLGFQVGASSIERGRIIADIQNKEIVEVLKDLLINQDKQITQQKADFEQLKKFTLTVLEDSYQKIGIDDASKGNFLKNYLVDSRPSWVKSWALDKVLIWRGTPQTSIPADLEPVIISQLSDSSKEIRLKTVNLIGLLQPMRTVDLAVAKLIAQFDVEQDDQVKNELLDKLGIVCSTALSRTSVTKISSETRLRVLGYASDYLSKDDIAKAKTGAKVMRQLLERDGMQEQDVKTYLNLLSERYNRQKQDPNNPLIPELLNAMVGLAADSSASKDYARKAFEPIFKEALNNDSDLVRETAIDGLGYINKTDALKILQNRIEKERSERARLKIIEFAKEVGGREDLDWLAVRLGQGTSSEAKQAWIAMMKIFDSVGIEVLNEWEAQLVSSNGKYNLTEQQKIDFLKIVLRESPAKDKPKYQEQIATRYFNIGQYDQAVNYFASLYDSAGTAEEKERILPKYLGACLRMPNEKLTAKLIMDYLSKNTFNPDSTVVSTIENYFKDAKVVGDKNIILKSLKGITLSDPKPGWQVKLQRWTDLINTTEQPKPPANTES